MILSINSNALVSFNSEAELLLNHVVKDTSNVSPLPVGAFAPEFHAHNISAEDIIGDITMSKTDIDGVKLSQFVSVKDERVGLEGAAYKSLRLLAEKIYKRKEVNPYVSFSAIEDVLFKWVIGRYTGKTSETLMEYCLPKLEAEIVKLFLWVPIFGVATEFSFDLGRTKVYNMQKQFFDTWEASFASHTRPNRADFQPRIDDFRHRLQGWAACTMHIEAEPTRAKEIVLEETENALALLRVCLPSNLHPSVPSYCRPTGREKIEKDLVFSTLGNAPASWYEGSSASFRPWILNKELFDIMGNAGLGILHQLYLLDIGVTQLESKPHE